jgi:hypothetical protein
MNNNEIRMFTLEPKSTLLPVKSYIVDKSNFKESNPSWWPNWVQALASKLRRRKVENSIAFLSEGQVITPLYETKDTVEYSEIVVNIKDLVNAIFKEERNLHLLYNRQVERIIVGRQAYKLMRGEADHYMSPLHFQLPPDVDSNVRFNGGILHLANMPVQMVPWFEGVLLLPKNDN